jgi:hypothetical protein
MQAVFARLTQSRMLTQSLFVKLSRSVFVILTQILRYKLKFWIFLKGISSSKRLLKVMTALTSELIQKNSMFLEIPKFYVAFVHRTHSLDLIISYVICNLFIYILFLILSSKLRFGSESNMLRKWKPTKLFHRWYFSPFLICLLFLLVKFLIFCMLVFYLLIDFSWI